MHHACESSSDTMGVIGELIAFHAELDPKNRLGDTPLHRASQLGKDAPCTKLIQVGTVEIRRQTPRFSGVSFKCIFVLRTRCLNIFKL